MSPRLSPASLATLPDDVERPRYDRAAIATGVVHLGIGAFHRGHQAMYFDEALSRGDRRWGVVGVSLRSAQVRDELLPQSGLYGVLVRNGESSRLRVVGSIRSVLVAPEDPAVVLHLLAEPQVHLVTLTITEKGYKLDPASGQPQWDDADIAADRVSLAAPRSALGFLVAGLAARRLAGLAPWTVLSCDNLPHNGRRLRAGVLALARAHDAALADWIDSHGAFPDTMIDRIVPAPTDDDRHRVADRLGCDDRGCVVTEPFSQWVIEDHFAGPRPDFAALGASLTADVRPWEHAKLRLLNGAHSAMAYLGGLAGVDYVHQFVALPEGRAYVEALWDESASTLAPPPQLDLAAYRRQLRDRFDNGALRHRLRQIATDGSQKLPQRLLEPLLLRLQAGAPAPCLVLGIAAWMRWQSSVDDHGVPFRVDDPLAAELARRLAPCANATERVDALLAVTAIFGRSAPQSSALRPLLVDALERLQRDGARAVLRALQ